MRTVRIAALLPALLAATLASASTGGYRFERRLDVTGTAWTRVALDGCALARGLPGNRWAIVSPEGRPVPIRVLTPPEDFIKARTLSVEEGDDGWTIVFDLGPTPVSHRRVEVDLIRRTSARNSRLEGSSDLQRWLPLGQGSLFRLGEQGNLFRSTLDYPPTHARYLRLRWPRRAGFPEFREVGVRPLVPAPEDAVVVPVDLRPEVPTSGTSSYRLELPGPGLRIRTLVLGDLEGQDDVGYRLYRSVSQHWEVLAAGVIQAGEPPRVDLDHAPDRSALRLELYGSDDRELSLRKVQLEVAPAWILFRPERTGRYALRYGGDPTDPPLEIAEGTAVGPVTDLWPAQHEKPLALPGIPARVSEPLRGVKPDTAGPRWTIDVSGARLGGVVRLALPDEILHEVDWRTGRLRVLAGDREVPFLSWTPDEPDLVLERADLRPLAEPGGPYDRITIAEAETSPWLSQIEVFAGAGERPSRVGLSFSTEGRPGVETRPHVNWSEWDCGHADVLDCRAAFDYLPAVPHGKIELLIETRRRAAPEPSFRTRAWRPRPSLVFVLPAGEPLALAPLRGSEVSPARYEIEAHATALLATPWTAATLDLESPHRAGERRETILRIALFVALGIGAMVLLWILARNLRAAPGRVR